MDNSSTSNRSLNQVRLMIEQWQIHGGRQGSMLYCAYAESVLALLRAAYRHCYLELGAKSAGFGVEADSLPALIAVLDAREVVSPELSELSNLECVSSEWLYSMLKASVPFSASSGPANAIIQSGGLDHQQCQQWLSRLQELLLRLRQSSEEW